MPTDSREIERDRREQWLLCGVWLFQVVIGGSFWLLVARYAYRAAVWAGFAIAAAGHQTMPFVQVGLLLICAYAIAVSFNLMD